MLRGFGIDVDADLFHKHEPGIDWHRFGPKAIADREFTIIAISVPWRERWEGRNDPHVGAGAAAEADQLQGIFTADQQAFRKKVVIVELPSAVGENAVPDRLRGVPRFTIREFSPEAIEDLVRLLTGQPSDPLPPLGKIPILPPRAHALPSQGAPARELPVSETESAWAEVNERLSALRAALAHFSEPQTSGSDPFALSLSLLRDRLRSEVSDLGNVARGPAVRADWWSPGPDRGGLAPSKARGYLDGRAYEETHRFAAPADAGALGALTRLTSAVTVIRE